MANGERAMTFLKILLAVAVGFTLGAVLFRTPTAHATPQSSGQAVVFIHAIWVDNPKLPVDKVIPGTHVSGISCIPKPIANMPDAALCYVATQNE
jgi:hypothetical protein